MNMVFLGKKRYFSLNSLFILWVFPILFSCASKNSTFLLPEGAIIEKGIYSHLFILAHHKKDSFLILKDPADTHRTIGAFYWGKGKNHYEGFTPIKKKNKVVALTGVFVGFMEHLSLINKIVAVDNTSFLASKKALKMAEENKLISVAASGNTQIEKIASIQPDIVFSYYINSKEKDDLNPLISNGIPVIFLQNFLENHPLGRAEWIKVFGWIFGKPEEANALFNEICFHYDQYKNLTASSKYKPKVLLNAPFQ